MAKKVQLSKKINGVVHQIYPKTVYDIVVDKNGKTLQQDIEAINSDLERIEDSIPTKLSDLQGGAEIVTESEINAKLDNYYTKDVVDSKLENIESGTVDLKNYYTKNEVYNKTEVDNLLDDVQIQDLSEYAKKSDLFSKDYNDLSNKPTIISENRVQELINQAQFPEGGEIKLENYYTKTEVYNKGEVDGKLASKQNKLESGINIKKINGESILGSGNITIEGGSSSDTKVNQTLTSTNSSYPLLFSYTANKSATSADAARFSTGLKYNPSTQSLLFPAATSGKSVNIGLGTKPSGTYNGLVIYNAGGSQSDADFINICAADVFIRKADGSMGGRIIAELLGNASTATTLETPRTINGVSFDGSSNIEIDTTHIGKEHNAVIYVKGPAKGKSLSKYEFHTTDGTLVSPKSFVGGIVYLLYNENVVSQAIPLNHVLTGNFFPIKVSTILTSASGDINTWTDAYLKCGITPTGPIILSIHLSDTNRTDVSNINLDNCMLEGHIYGTF